MKQNIIHIGLDVDDTQYHGSAFNKYTGEVIDFKSRPTLKGLLQQLDRMARHFSGCAIKLCYEAPYLKKGRNCIAVLVHVYGIDTAWYEQCRDYWQGIFWDGGLYFDAVIKNNSTTTILSDPQWRCIRSHAWKQDVPKSGWGQDFIEDFDARKMPADWNEVDFDDSDWPYVTEMILHTNANDHAKGWMNIEPFPTLIPREIPALSESSVEPEKIVGIYAVKSGSDLPLDERIYKETLIENTDVSVNEAAALLVDDDQNTVVRTEPGKDVAILIRFERLHSGYPFIEIDALGGEIVELAVAETIPGGVANTEICDVSTHTA